MTADPRRERAQPGRERAQPGRERVQPGRERVQPGRERVQPGRAPPRPGTAPLRALLAALAVGAAYPGVWATVAPRSFYGDFPGAGRHWVDRLPAYNEHLVTDAGAFYLAFAVMLAWAAARPAQALAVPLCVAWSLFSALHLFWHVTNLDGFPTSDAIAQTAGLAAYLAAGIAAIVLSSRSRPARAAS